MGDDEVMLTIIGIGLLAMFLITIVALLVVYSIGER